MVKRRPMRAKKKKPVKELAQALKKQNTKREPVWKGPSDTDPQGGITQSLLSTFLCCRERFRIRVVEGLSPPDQFNHRIEYGNMWHLCEEAYATADKHTGWKTELHDYCVGLSKKYPLSQEQIVKWYEVCKVQFPIYLKYWAKDPDEKKRKPVMAEQSFRVPYTLPSGRIVQLRGKWDGVSKYGRKYYLDEHKTKGEVSPEQIRRQMDFDLQTMLYLVALYRSRDDIAGVRYNVVRRPLAGGKHSIRQHKPTKSNPKGESSSEYYTRLGGLIAEEPEHYFHRWKVDITGTDVERFCTQFLNPILEQLCNWWHSMQHCLAPWKVDNDREAGPGASWTVTNPVHWRTPYGFWNVLAEGGSTDLDEYLATGSEVGLERGQPLFRELEEE